MKHNGLLRPNFYTIFLVVGLMSGFTSPTLAGVLGTPVDTHSSPTTAKPATPNNDTSESNIPPTTATITPDPYEGFNRVMFNFNDKLDKYFLKPIATVYNAIMPKPLNEGIHNFFNNINTVTTIADDALQLHFFQMSNDLWRLGINSTIGIGGLIDVAGRMNLPYYVNDFGLTMATWGYKNSSYLVLPFFGPNTIRDGLSIPVDYFAFSVYPYIQPESLRYELYALGVVDRRAQLIQYQSVFDEATYDEYSFMRNAYIQRRNYQIEQNAHRTYKDYLEQLASKPVAQQPAANYDNA